VEYTWALKTVRENAFVNQGCLKLTFSGKVIEKAPKHVPPVFTIPPEQDSGYSRLKRFTGLSSSSLLILGLRRPTPVHSPQANSNDSINIYTSVGFRQERVADYIESAEILRPDIFIGPADVVYSHTKSSLKRREKMAERTTTWTETLLAAAESWPASDESIPKPALFAPILAISADEQRLYLSDLASTHAPHIDGLALYDPALTASLPASLSAFPRLSLSTPSNPHVLLHHIALGVDISLLPFITSSSTSGVALTFTFPAPTAPSASTALLPLGVSLWPSDLHASSMTPLSASCTCYACSTHSRAYVNHLLHAKEMLSWTLLQIHNHAVIDAFFAGVRASIAAGTFEADVKAFEGVYEAEVPKGQEEGKRGGPRLRGYEVRSAGGEGRLNERAYGPLEEGIWDEDEEGVEEATGAEELVEHGMGERS
jgi:queuine tRNA-ribosyltransferase accessory subunit